MNAKAGPSRIPLQHKEQQVGLSFKATVDLLSSFREQWCYQIKLTAVEIVIHTIICIRQVYPPNTFTRRRAHGVAVYQSRHPEVRAYIGRVVSALRNEMERGTLRRVTVMIHDVESRAPMERFIIDFGYMGLEGLEGPQRDAKIQGAPDEEGLSLMLRGFLIRLVALDGQLLDNPGDTSFAIILETKDDIEPETPSDGAS
ncbi:uncharacterized protein COLE_06609 [Cutaneotrichosporon oleaginosum]|nr:hypothetical protein COLE_06609 [Cutaneotrichosporon oleaginosum]